MILFSPPWSRVWSGNHAVCLIMFWFHNPIGTGFSSESCLIRGLQPFLLVIYIIKSPLIYHYLIGSQITLNHTVYGICMVYTLIWAISRLNSRVDLLHAWSIWDLWYWGIICQRFCRCHPKLPGVRCSQSLRSPFTVNFLRKKMEMFYG